MKCPHCLVAIHATWNEVSIGGDRDLAWKIAFSACPNCKKYIVHLLGINPSVVGASNVDYLVYPKGIARSPLSDLVPGAYANDYKEACQVLLDSPKASAALSRRCLQNLLRNIATVKHSDLSREIDEILSSGKLPSHLAEAIDAIRNIGNFAAHPVKSTNSGEIVDVEAGEAEWLLDVLEGLLDFYFVQPALLLKKKAALNKKLTDAGKPPMK
jgi:hypothetical protein